MSGPAPIARAAKAPEGVTPPTSAGRSGFLSDVIVELGFASRETVDKAVRAARTGTTVERVLLDMGAISEEQLARATAERHGIDYVDLEGFQVDAAAANLIEPDAARRYRAVPVARLGGGLLVAMADPADALGLNEVAALTELAVRPAVASRPALEALLEALPLDDTGPDEVFPAPVVEERPAPAVEERPAPAPAPEPPVGQPPAPAPPVAAPRPDPPRLRDELEALKLQLAGAEAKLAGADTGADEVERLRLRLADAEAELEEARLRLREAKEVGAELEALRENLARAQAGLEAAGAGAPSVPAATTEQLRAELTVVKQERDELRSQLDELRVAHRRMQDALRELAGPDGR